MVREVRRYGRWLRENYADLEHKEVWQSFVVLSVILLGFGIYTSEIGGLANKYIVQVNNIILICYLLWRVETLSDLSISQLQDLPIETTLSLSMRHRSALPLGLSKNIEPLLKQYCEESRLYLQHDINISRLAREIGINRLYLSQYFSRQGTTYNAYVNGLRIDHFVSLYRRAVAAKVHITVRSLAQDSGFRNYATFSNAFKQRMGKNVTAWIQESDSEHQSSET